MDANSDARQTGDGHEGTELTSAARPAAFGWLRSTAKIAVFYVALPLALYYLLRSADLNAAAALLLSGVLPAGGVAIGAVRHRRLDVVGALVLAGMLVGGVIGLISHSARPILLEGSVPTGVFGVSCLGSLRTQRPLMYGMALEFAGPDSAQGREMARLWQYDGYRRVFRTITVVWGAGFLIEAAGRVVIVYSTSAGTALSISKVMPWVWVGVLSAWTVAYGRYRKKVGERMAAAAGLTLDQGLAAVTGETPQEGRAE